MPSLLPGFEYDIFISYRQKDNRTDQWVTNFVQSLREELDATFKEEVSVYFDENPHDGLLENHDVDESLKEKLKCLVFIPIISQTYCDPKCFAWRHEFLVFNEMAESDEFGLKMKLANGNVASRILPVQIHDLDSEDKLKFENEYNNPLRAIEFIFRSAGVIRPLLINEDHLQDNQSKTYYRDQINKVARGVKDLILAMQGQPAKNQFTSAPVNRPTRSLKQNKFAQAGVGVLLCVILASLFYFFLSDKSKPDPSPEKSIAVLPFKNLSGDADQAYFSHGMMDEVLNQLVKIGDLKVSSRTSSMQYVGSTKSLKDIAKELGVSNILEGSVQKSGNRIRIITQLIDATTDKHLWSESFDRDLSDVFSIQTEISKEIALQLNIVISSSEKRQLENIPTTSSLAYDYYLKGMEVYYNSQIEPGYKPAIPFFDQAIAIDPNFTIALAQRATCHAQWFFNKAKDWKGKDVLAKADLEKAEKLGPDLVEVRISNAYVLYLTQRRYEDALKIVNELELEYPSNGSLYLIKGAIQRRMGLFRQSIISIEKSMELDPGNPETKYEAGRLYEAVREYDMAIKYYSLSNKSLLAFVYLSKGDTSTAMGLFEEWESRIGVSYYRRDYRSVLEAIAAFKQDINSNSVLLKPKALAYAEIYFLMNDETATKKYALEAVELLQKELQSTPADFRIHISLGLAYAYAGECEKATEAGKNANQLMSIAIDAFLEGPATNLYMAYIYLICKEYDKGLEIIEFLLTVPGADFANISVPFLLIDPFYGNLRELPRFQKLTASTPSTNY